HLSAAEDRAWMCTPASEGGQSLFAHDVLKNEGSESAVLRDVRLVDADNLEVVSFDVLSHEDDGFRGVGDPVPLSEVTPTVQVDEEVMVRVLVELTDPTLAGTAGGFEVEYSDAEGRG